MYDRICVGEVHTRIVRGWINAVHTHVHNGATYCLGPGYEDFCLYHSACPVNAVAALKLRMLRPTPNPTRNALRVHARQARRLAREIKRKFSLTPLSHEQVVSNCRGRRKRRYMAALKELRTEGLTRRDARVTMFVKADKCNGMYDKVIRRKKANKPRAICFRGFKFCLDLARYVKPVEHCLKYIKGRCKYPIFAKGLDWKQRGDLLRKKYERFGRCYIYNLDATAFDGSVRREHLDAVHSLYSMVYGSSSHLDWLHSCRRDNRVCGPAGISAFIEGRRMSGDADTSFGNCIIMASAIMSCMLQQRHIRYELLNDGDDCVLMTNTPIHEVQFNRAMRDIGFQAALEPVDSFSKIEFCRSSPVCVDGQWQLVNQPVRKLVTMFTHYKYFDKPCYGILKQIALGNSFMFDGIPVIGPYAQHVYQLFSSYKDSKIELRDVSFDLYKKYGDWRSIPSEYQFSTVTSQTRVSFEKTFGISVERQLSLESYLCNLTRDNFELNNMPSLLFNNDLAGSQIISQFNIPEVNLS